MKLNRLSLLIFGNAALCGALACAFVVPTTAAAGTVYRCTGANGQLAFTNKPGGLQRAAPRSPAMPMRPRPNPRPRQATTKHAEYRSEPVLRDQLLRRTPPLRRGMPPRRHRRPEARTSKSVVAPSTRLPRANGVVEYTNMRPNRGGYQLLFTYIGTCFACNVHSTINWMSTALNLNAYRAEVRCGGDRIRGRSFAASRRDPCRIGVQPECDFGQGAPKA